MFFTETTSTILSGIKSLTPADPEALRTANTPLPSPIYLSALLSALKEGICCVRVLSFVTITHIQINTFALLSESGAWKSI